MERLELLVRREGERVVLAAPQPGFATLVEPRGRVLVPGAVAALLRTLEVTRELVVPAGVLGRVASDRPERVHAPVSRGTALFELVPLEAGGLAAGPEATARSDPGAPAFRAPYSGRFWRRAAPGDPPFVEAGAVIAAGATVGLLEVMKTFTHLHYEATGGLPARARVVRVLADDGAEVDEDEPLIEVEPA